MEGTKKADKFPKWFEDNNTRSDFAEGLKEYKGKKNLKFLQIGVFTGNASAWLMENILTDQSCTLTDIDPWCGNLQHESMYDWSELEEAYDEQVKPYGNRVKKNKSYSEQWLKDNRNEKYDFIYIDGDHRPEAVTADAELSWGLLKPSGIMAFDDYEWNHPDGVELNPKPAIDKFLKDHSDELEIIKMGWQVWVRKLGTK